MRLTVRHYYDFGPATEEVGDDLVRPDAWDTVRETVDPFRLPDKRAEWEEKAFTAELAARARDIAAVAARLGARNVCSYGVGNAGLELNLAREAPDLGLSCTDFTPRTIERLRELFPEANVVRHDLRHDDPLPADLHLMHRIDAELPAETWQAVLPRFHEPILFVPAVLLDWLTAAKEIARRLHKRRAARAGYFRSEDALRDLWSASHVDERVQVGDLTGFVLRRRAG